MGRGSVKIELKVIYNKLTSGCKFMKVRASGLGYPSASPTANPEFCDSGIEPTKSVVQAGRLHRRVAHNGRPFRSRFAAAFNSIATSDHAPMSTATRDTRFPRSPMSSLSGTQQPAASPPLSPPVINISQESNALPMRSGTVPKLNSRVHSRAGIQIPLRTLARRVGSLQRS